MHEHKAAVPFTKLVRDGKVGVLVSGGFGAGWYTWNTRHLGLAMDGEIAQAILDGDKPRALKIAHERYGNFYDDGIDGLEVKWVPQGAAFEITEYDGNESLRLIDMHDFIVA